MSTIFLNGDEMVKSNYKWDLLEKSKRRIFEVINKLLMTKTNCGRMYVWSLKNEECVWEWVNTWSKSIQIGFYDNKEPEETRDSNPEFNLHILLFNYYYIQALYISFSVQVFNEVTRWRESRFKVLNPGQSKFYLKSGSTFDPLCFLQSAITKSNTL